MPLSLPDVTLCAVTAVNHELTVRAMNECLKHCSFADVVLVSDRPVKAPFRVEIMPPFPSGAYYAPFVCKNLGKYTPSAFNLLVQYDSHIVDPSAWTDEFLGYDYIGAKWPWQPEGMRVGNSGFCLRSKKLIDIVAQFPLPPTGTFVDDELICFAMRDVLEKKFNLKIAPEKIADKFAYERHVPEQPTFGFHGIFNFWRHIDDAGMEKIPDLLDDVYVPLRPFLEVLLHYYQARNYPVFCRWYWRLREHIGKEQIEGHLMPYVNDPVFASELVRIGEEKGAIYGVKSDKPQSLARTAS